MINTPKNSPLVLKMVVLVAIMACSVFICSVFLKQLEKPTEHHIVKANLAEKTQVHSATVIAIEKSLPNLLKADLMKNNQSNMVRENRTQEILSHSVIVNLNEATIPVAVITNTSAVGNNISVLTLPTALSTTSTEEILPKKTGVNLTDKSSSNPKLSKCLLHRFDYNKTKAYIRNENECMPVSLFAIVSMQRSGSKWFEALLNSHENIRSHGEIFYNVNRKCNMAVIKTVLNKVYSLNWNATTFRRKKKNCMAAVGFKWMLNQGIFGNHEGIVDYFNRRGVSVILLFRRNHLRRLVSLKANNHDGIAKDLNGTHKAHVNTKREAEILASYKPRLNVKHLIPTLEHMNKLLTDTLLNFKGTRHMVVYYEDLVQNQTQTMMGVLEFLRAPQRQLMSGHVKIHTRPLAQQIQNWKAVVRLIKRTKFSNFIASNDYKFN